jgi:hypothetical protein
MYIWKQTLAIERFLEQPRAVFGVMGILPAAKLRMKPEVRLANDI